MFLPISNVWSIDHLSRTSRNEIVDNHDLDHGEEKLGTGTQAKRISNQTIVTLATVALKCQVFWIYLDAGQGKYNDPLGGWSFVADPLPALDTYARHTVSDLLCSSVQSNSTLLAYLYSYILFLKSICILDHLYLMAKVAARYLYALMTPVGLRFMTPTVVYAELLACPITLLGSYFGNRHAVLSSIALICSLHIGIAFTVRNTVLLSSVACVAWCAFLPPGPTAHTYADEKKKEKNKRVLMNGGISNKLSACIIIPMIIGNIWFETMSGECNQSMKHIWSTVLHNRWNVFIGAEEYVTWEIAPGRLADGSVVDIWGRKDDVDWQMPGTGAPCTSTARPGRWRSFPYLAELDGEEGEALWSYLCRQWDEENGVDALEEGDEDSGYNGNAHRKLLRYNFFMLQADVLPNMGFSSTRKRLIHSHDCTKVNFAVVAKAKVKETQTISVPTANDRVEL